MKDLRQKGIFKLLIFLLLLLVFSCQLPQGYYLRVLSEEEIQYLVNKLNPASQGLSSWKDLSFAIKRSIEFVSSKPQKSKVFCEYLDITWGDLKNSLTELLKILPDLDSNPQLLAQNFKWYELLPSPVFTGYFEPLLKASLTKRGDYPYPVYGLPKDLKSVNLGLFHPRWRGERLVYRIEDGRIKPYYTREEIEKKEILRGKAPVIAWVKDPFDLYLLQVQGSGRLELPDGSVSHIGYAGKNGREFIPLGKILVESGYLKQEEVNLENIKRFAKDHSEIIKKLIYRDPSYVFFEILPDGPIGAMGKKLTPYVSLATDPSILPLGSMVIFFLDLPKSSRFHSLPIRGIGLAQDKGGAIKGHRIDLFCGFGDKAEFVAGHLNTEGRVFLLLKK